MKKNVKKRFFQIELQQHSNLNGMFLYYTKTPLVPILFEEPPALPPP